MVLFFIGMDSLDMKGIPFYFRDDERGFRVSSIGSFLPIALLLSNVVTSRYMDIS